MVTVIRKFLWRDVLPLSILIERVWNMDAYGDDISMSAAQAYALTCLSRSTKKYTAFVNGEFAGVLMLWAKGRRKGYGYKGRLQRITSYMESLESYPRFAEDFANMERVDEELRKTYAKDIPGEIVLMILSERFRGMGIGKTMFNLACRYFCTNGVDRFFLYTDTDCNYGFYDAMGAEKLGGCDTYCLGEELGMYIYTYDIDCNNHIEL